MSSRWSIRRKLLVCLALLFIMVLALSFSGFRGAYAYRGLVRDIGRRANELQEAIQLVKATAQLRLIANSAIHRPDFPIDNRYDNIYVEIYLEREQDDRQVLRAQVMDALDEVRIQVGHYQSTLDENRQSDFGTLPIDEDERTTLGNINSLLQRISTVTDGDWILGEVDETDIKNLEPYLTALHNSALILPNCLQRRMSELQGQVRSKYRTWIVLTWITSFSAALLLTVIGVLMYSWVFCPLRTVVRGSRRVASGEFSHRIELDSQDEMGELAAAMNNMTRRFQEIRDDLDEQVRVRTREVVRSEQMASVGFLAAGVAHEINNPLASIALCAESLEDRLHSVIQADDVLPDDEHNDEIAVVRNYLRMVQDEAFRCKQITEQLLDFARLEEVKRQRTDLRLLVEEVLEMLGHLGKYKHRRLKFDAPEAVYAVVSAQEIKQVVLNLLTNALDSLDADGKVEITLDSRADVAHLSVRDTGCGMSEDVKQHLFEPFYTRRRDGQGTGLGLSITYRIVSDHGGTITPFSEGVGKGSEMVVTLPISYEENRYHTRAA
ncbi:MAG: HAMP domain-containing sensor histidine kinase [Planctomycetota bacterium]